MTEPQAGGSSSQVDGLSWKWLAGAVLAVILSILLGGIAARHRLPWSDEGWFSSAAYNLAHRGIFGTTVLDPIGANLTRIDQRTYWVMPLYLLGEAAWYTLVPSTVLWTRIFTLLWVPVFAAAYYLFLAYLLNPRTAALAVILLVLSFVFINNASYARPDLMCCALGFCGLANYVWLRQRSFIQALFVSNVFVAASFLTHPNAILHFIALIVLVLWMDRQQVSLRAILVAAIPYVLFLSGWSLYIMRDTQAFREQMLANATNDRWARSLNPVTILGKELERYFVTFGLVTRGTSLPKAYMLLAYVASLFGVLLSPQLRRQRGVSIILVLLVLYFALMAVFNQKLSAYLVHILPLYSAILSVWILSSWDRWPRLRPTIIGAVALLVVVETGGILVRARQQSYIGQQTDAVAFIRTHVDSSARIVGTSGLLYMMNFDDRLRDDLYLGLKSGWKPDMIVIDPVYRQSFGAFERDRPNDMQRIRERLSEYRLAYNSGDYAIYLRATR